MEYIKSNILTKFKIQIMSVSKIVTKHVLHLNIEITIMEFMYIMNPDHVFKLLRIGSRIGFRALLSKGCIR